MTWRWGTMQTEMRDLGLVPLCAWDLRLVAECRCGDGFCQSFKTESHADGQPFGPGPLPV